MWDRWTSWYRRRGIGGLADVGGLGGIVGLMVVGGCRRTRENRWTSFSLYNFIKSNHKIGYYRHALFFKNYGYMYLCSLKDLGRS